MDKFFTSTIVFALSGLVFTLLGIPLYRRKVPRNSTYGFRTARSLKNDEVWYLVNQRSGKGFIVAGLIIMIGTILLYGYGKHFESELRATWMMIALVIVCILGTVVYSTIYLNKISIED